MARDDYFVIVAKILDYLYRCLKITDDEIRSFVSSADIMLMQWGGRRQVFYGDDGVCVITKSGDDWIYKTAWKKDDFDSNTDKILEVIKKYAK